MRRWFSTILLIVGMLAPGRADLLVNEVYPNPRTTPVEPVWIELYNTGPGVSNLSFYTLTVDNQTFALSGTLDPESFLIITPTTLGWRQAFLDTLEQTALTFLQLPIDLGIVNDSAVLRLGIGQIISRIDWAAAPAEGQSYERSSSGIDLSVDPTGATPGFLNSVTPIGDDLALAQIRPLADSGETVIQLTITNRGVSQVSGANVDVYDIDTAATDSLGLLLVSEALPPIDSGFSAVLNLRLTLDGVYRPVIARLSDDVRTRNNRRAAIAPGAEFPPLVLNEVLANPTGGLLSEWIEIRNRQDTSIDLTGWWLGDALSSVPLPSLSIDGGGYVVLVQNEFAFDNFYPISLGRVTAELAGWPTLNQPADIVRLLSPIDIEADRFSYFTVWDNNQSWSRGEVLGRENEWGRSEVDGGTPGDSNRVRFTATAEGSSVEIESRIFTPNDDGRDDELVIRLDPAPADGYTLKIYDRHGRLVRTLIDNQPDFRGEYRWNGRTDAGRQLPTGMYIVLFEAVGLESSKTTVVIAP